MTIFRKYCVVYTTSNTGTLSTRFILEYCRSHTLKSNLGESVKWKTTQTDSLYRDQISYNVHDDYF